MQFGSYLYLGYLSPWAVPIFTVHKVVKTGPSLGPSSLAPPPRCYQVAISQSPHTSGCTCERGRGPGKGKAKQGKQRGSSYDEAGPGVQVMTATCQSLRLLLFSLCAGF